MPVCHIHTTLQRNACPTVTQMILFRITVVQQMGSLLNPCREVYKGISFLCACYHSLFLLFFSSPLFLFHHPPSKEIHPFPFTAGYNPPSLLSFNYNEHFLTIPYPTLKLLNIPFMIYSFLHTLLVLVYLTNTLTPCSPLR